MECRTEYCGRASPSVDSTLIHTRIRYRAAAKYRILFPLFHGLFQKVLLHMQIQFIPLFTTPNNLLAKIFSVVNLLHNLV